MKGAWVDRAAQLHWVHQPAPCPALVWLIWPTATRKIDLGCEGCSYAEAQHCQLDQQVDAEPQPQPAVDLHHGRWLAYCHLCVFGLLRRSSHTPENVSHVHAHVCTPSRACLHATECPSAD